MADGSSQMRLVEIQRQYLQMAPLKEFIWKAIEQVNLDLEAQRKILQMTYFFTTNSKCAPSVSYQRLFLKHILRLCEDKCIEISDELYEAYGDVVGKEENLNDKCFKAYVLPCGALVTLEETQQYISKGTTGLSTWMAGEYLAEWVLENLSTFHDRNIIELGCGVGLTGLVTCSMSSPFQYMFSDCHYEVLKALHCNLELNGFAVSQTEASSSCVSKSTKFKESYSKSNMNEESGELPLGNANVQIHHLTKLNESHDCANHSQISLLHNSQLTGSKTQEIESTLQECDCPNISQCMACISDHSGRDDTDSQSNRAMEFIVHLSRQSSNSVMHLHEGCTNHSGSPEVDICKLDWTTVKMSDLKRLSVGIILAADVIYDTDLTPALVRTLHLLLSACGDNGGRPVAYIASTIRNPQTYQLFLDKLCDHNISWSEVTGPVNQVFYYDRSCEIKIIKLQV